jgi:hypothetical protein
LTRRSASASRSATSTEASGLRRAAAPPRHRALPGLGEAPAGQRFGARVHEADRTLQIGAQDRVDDRVEHRREPALAVAQPRLQGVALERDLDRGEKVADLERLDT